MSPSQNLLLITLLFLAGATLLQAAGTANPEIDVKIKNILESKEIMQVHCKDKDSDYGVQKVQPGQVFEFRIWPSGTTDYYCKFFFGNAIHWFDVFVYDRDWNGCMNWGFCHWLIKEAGPCWGSYPNECYPWNKNV